MKSLSDFLEYSAIIYEGCIILVGSVICAIYIHFIGITIIAVILIVLITAFAVLSIISFIQSLMHN